MKKTVLILLATLLTSISASANNGYDIPELNAWPEMQGDDANYGEMLAGQISGLQSKAPINLDRATRLKRISYNYQKRLVTIYFDVFTDNGPKWTASDVKDFTAEYIRYIPDGKGLLKLMKRCNIKLKVVVVDEDRVMGSATFLAKTLK